MPQLGVLVGVLLVILETWWEQGWRFELTEMGSRRELRIPELKTAAREWLMTKAWEKRTA
jgi:hypothetical protein